MKGIMVPKEGSKTESCVMEFSLRLILLSLGASTLLAYGLGRISSGTIMQNRPLSTESCDNIWDNTFPVPQLIKGKEVPDCVSTNKYFDTSASVSSLFLGIGKDDDSSMEEENQVKCDGSQDTCTPNQEEGKHNIEYDEDDNEKDNVMEGDDEDHLPAGQHLLVDVMNVDKDFLSSEVRLAHAMMQVVNQSKLTLLSYHCHSHVGVSCVGVLLESHIAFHTWPEKGVITLDLFTCGSGKLVPLIPLVESLFVIPQALSDTVDVVKKPFVTWSHKLRGFRTEKQHDYINHDIGSHYERSHTAEKKEVIASETDFQTFHALDSFDDNHLLYASYLRSITDDGSYESEHPELYQLDRILYLDGVMQSGRKGIESYHEALVHPAMFAHGSPERVAIIGGGECATLREVLKHNTVKHVQMIEIDEKMVELSRTYLPDWSDCSDLEGSADWCGDDDRAHIYYEDALAWFSDRFSEDSKASSEDYKEDPFDLLIMDALDPEDDVPFADMLYTSDSFMSTLFNALSDNGVIVFQLGCAPSHDDTPEQQSGFYRREYLVDSLEEVGFESVHVYTEGHAGFEHPWSFLVAMKDDGGSALWNRNEAEINLEVHQRIIHTHSGTPALKHFDGSTMESYRVPHMVFQAAYCKRVPTPESCTIYNTVRRKNYPITNMEVRTSDVEGGGRGVFAKVDIEKGSFIDIHESLKKVHFHPSTVETMYATLEKEPQAANDIGYVLRYADGYGWQTIGKGEEEYFVDSGIITFINHGCNGTFNIDDTDFNGITEQNINLTSFPEKRDVFDPFLDRHYVQHYNTPSFTLIDIKAGDEILCNYLTLSEAKDDWILDIMELKGMCNHAAVGFISELEQASMVEN